MLKSLNVPSRFVTVPNFRRCGSPQSWGRILLVAAHPDDEVLALGGQLASVQPWIFHLTTGALLGDPEEVALRRQTELAEALAMAGIAPDRCATSAVPDQSAVDFLPRIYGALQQAIGEFRPDCLLTHPYEGGHADHDAASLICSIAAARAGLPVYEFTSYHNGSPRRETPTWKTGSFLTSPEGTVVVPLMPKQKKEKEKLLSVFASQKDVLSLFTHDREIFRVAPAYHFDKPPHAGVLLYESFGPQLNFPSWRERVVEGVSAISQDVQGTRRCFSQPA